MNPRMQMSVVFVFLSNLLFPSVLDAEFKIDFKADGNSVAVISLTIDGDLAKTKVADEVEQFNLKDQSWLDPTTGKWMSLAQCKQWAEQSKAKSLKSAETAPENIRAFLLWSLDPAFTVEKSDDTLRLKSGQVDYVVEGKVVGADPRKYFQYAALNAYKKAMTERKLPPYAELKAIEEVEKLGYIPRKLTVTMQGIPNSPKIEIEVVLNKP